MNKNTNTQANLSTRLIAFLVVLAVGIAMGWFNEGGATSRDAGTSGVVATQQQESSTERETPSDDESSLTATTETSEMPSDPATTSDDTGSSTVAPTRGPTVEEDGWYTTKDEVALYIHTYGHLPGNFISKTKARDRGWVNTEGNLDEVCPGMSIGGSEFYNDDGLLPDKRGRRWTECDINYHGGYRGAERIVFSNDGLIYYTGDHYVTFERLY